ncbi:peptidyl-prolyl cis-trans isomerase, putative [Paecilomyces variotii No. 5]|uniref:Enhancer of mRNA-decapping protein 3 n=1 Tax=Byssochlamys spectabilis (strain No. 5 / NBRC 109023) TaxID=1356009 RepID=V5FMQ6_BYSSN|nr:peptidyl-prolyl cis-trans isomerase, putative [Paecilomyces variotii No. 5]
MASDFIGFNVLVTLKSPPNARIQGTVADVVGQRLTLENVTLLWNGQRLPRYHIEGAGIADLEVSSGQVPRPSSTTNQFESHQQKHAVPANGIYDKSLNQSTPVETTPKATPQPFVDPAILSFSKPPQKTAAVAPVELSGPDLGSISPVVLPGNAAAGPSQANQVPSFPAGITATQSTITPSLLTRHDSNATAILTEPFNNLGLNGNNAVAGDRDGEEDLALDGSVPEGRVGAAPLEAPLKYTGKRSRRGGRNKLKEGLVGDVNVPGAALNTNPKAKGWRQTAFVEPSYPQASRASAQEKMASMHSSGKRRKQRNLKSYAEDTNGWATEDATDIQELGDFDFQSNLSKFDKRRVFDEIRNDDTTADEDRLVSFNRKARPGTNGGKNLHYTENVLDSPPAKWNSEAGETEEEVSDGKFSSGNYSGRDRSRTSTRPQSRKSSTILGQPLMPPQVNSIGRAQLGSSRNASPRPSKQSISASPMNGPTSVASTSLRLTTTNRSCPTVSPLQMLEVEQLAIAELGLTEDMITENAGRGVAEAAVAQLSSESAASTLLLLTGNHRTGARAVAAARHLRNRGHRVTLCLLGLEHENELLENCRKQLEIFRKIGGRVLRWEELSARLATSDFAPDLVVDALFGMHISFEDLRSDDQAAAFEMIAWINRSGVDILSVDVPSGISASSGDVTHVEGARLSVSSKSIVCLAAPKTGVLNALLAGEGQLWNITVADIGISQVVWRNFRNMGKGTDKLYITHSEWASEDSFGASAGAGVSRAKREGAHASFKRLPYNFCSLSLQPFSHPVCTPSGTIFDITNILPWLKKHGTNPVDGSPLKSSDLIKLNFAKNEAGEYVDPVTYKVFTDNTHIVALRNTGNVFAWDTVEKLNVKPKMWRDLVTDEEFGRKDIITLQDPQNIQSRDLSSFKYLKEGETFLTEEQERERSDPASNVNVGALGSSAKILKAKEAVAKARAERAQQAGTAGASSASGKGGAMTKSVSQKTSMHQSGKPVPYNAAKHTTGLAAASFTSTGLTPHTSGELALLTEEQYMLKRGRVKIKGYARISTNVGDLNLELHTEYAPKAVWNFLQLAKKGYYNGVIFHRNIKGFMIQGGDPTGTGRGGESIWGKNFADEFEGPMKHDARGTVSMANKGKNTNSSQFFIAYRALPHLNNKHTIFARLIDDPSPSSTTLNKMETHPVDSSNNRPEPDIVIKGVTIFVDPFEEFLNQKRQAEEAEKAKAAGEGDPEKTSREIDDEQMTWTGKRVRGAGDGRGSESSAGVGKYLKAALADRAAQDEDEIVEYVDDEPEREPSRKKMKSSGGFGNFDSW